MRFCSTLLLHLSLACLLSIVAPLPASGQNAAEAATEQETATIEEEEPSWELRLGLSYVATSGNSETSSGGIKTSYLNEWPVWSLEAAAFALRAEDEDVVTAERYGASVAGGRELSERLSLTAGLALETDEFSGIDLRSVADLGLARRWGGDEEGWKLKTRAAFTWTREELVGSSGSEESFGALFGASGEWTLTETATASSKLVYFPSFEDGDDYRLDAEIGVQAALAAAWALKVAYEVRYDNQPVAGFETTDTTTTVSLVLELPRG